MTEADTIAAIATAQGRGGIAVIRVSGPEALPIVRQLTRVGQTAEIGGPSVRKIYPPSASESSFIDEAVILVFRAPHSYTGEDVVEIQCHGGVVTPRRILEACYAAGARQARRGEFTQRAFLNGRLDYDQAESVLDLIDAKTARAADAALAGLSGSKRRELKALYDSAVDLSTRLEYALDVDEGELPDGFAAEIASQMTRLADDIAGALRRLTEGRLLRNGALVVLAGPPNAGKSSLMNALLEENRVLVSERPGTTRDTIEECLDLDGWPIRLVDTAGLRETSDDIEAEGVRRSNDLIAKADLVLLLGEAEGDASDVRTISVHAKCDLGRGEGLNVSSKTNEGIGELKREIVRRLEAKVGRAESSDGGLDTSHLSEALRLLSSPISDLVLAANAVRRASEHLGALVGATYSEDFLNNLFSRFCVGK